MFAFFIRRLRLLKKKPNLVAVLTLVIVLAILQSGILQLHSPIRVQMMLASDNGGSSLQTVATTWQSWTMQMADGSTKQYSSDTIHHRKWFIVEKLADSSAVVIVQFGPAFCLESCLGVSLPLKSLNNSSSLLERPIRP